MPKTKTRVPKTKTRVPKTKTRGDLVFVAGENDAETCGNVRFSAGSDRPSHQRHSDALGPAPRPWLLRRPRVVVFGPRHLLGRGRPHASVAAEHEQRAGRQDAVDERPVRGQQQVQSQVAQQFGQRLHGEPVDDVLQLRHTTGVRVGRSEKPRRLWGGGGGAFLNFPNISVRRFKRNINNSRYPFNAVVVYFEIFHCRSDSRQFSRLIRTFTGLNAELIFVYEFSNHSDNVLGEFSFYGEFLKLNFERLNFNENWIYSACNVLLAIQMHNVGEVCIEDVRKCSTRHSTSLPESIAVNELTPMLLQIALDTPLSYITHKLNVDVVESIPTRTTRC